MTMNMDKVDKQVKCDYTLADLEGNMPLAQAIERRMKDSEFSCGGMLPLRGSLIDELRMVKEKLKDRNLLAHQFFDKVQLLRDLTSAKGTNDDTRPSSLALMLANLFGETPTEKVNEQPQDPFATTPRQFDEKLAIPSHPQWSRSATINATIKDRFKITMTVWNGSQKCPFHKDEDKRYHGYEYGDRDYLIENLVTGKAMVVSDLAAHMAGAHGFFEDSPFGYYSFPMELAADILEINPGKDYKSIKNTITCHVTRGMFQFGGIPGAEFSPEMRIFSSDEMNVYEQVAADGTVTKNFEMLKDGTCLYEGVVFEGKRGLYHNVQVAEVKKLDVESSLAII